MKILAIGGTGLLGKAVIKNLEKRHEVIIASQNQAQIQVDISNPDSIKQMYEKVGPVQAVCCMAGQVSFAPFNEMTQEKLETGLKNKLLGQVNLVRIGSEFVEKGGSFTLISGILNEDPIFQGTSAAMVNGALNSFVLAASYELREKHRINIISPTVFEEAMDKYINFFQGYKPIAVKEAALAYQKSIEGYQTGQVIKVGH